MENMKSIILMKPQKRVKFEKFRKDFGLFSGHPEKGCWHLQDDPKKNLCKGIFM
jgi:hypothetical protein